MMSLASQMYDYYVKPYLGEKGQDLVEYALLLAIVVGIGFLIYQSSGLNDNLKTIFQQCFPGYQLCSFYFYFQIRILIYCEMVIKEPLLRQEFFGQGSSGCCFVQRAMK